MFKKKLLIRCEQLFQVFIWRELLYFFSALMLSFIILEIIWPNIILAYFNLNYLLLVCLIIALILLIVSDYQKKSIK